MESANPVVRRRTGIIAWFANPLVGLGTLASVVGVLCLPAPEHAGAVFCQQLGQSKLQFTLVPLSDNFGEPSPHRKH
jgi:hypothetical protein